MKIKSPLNKNESIVSMIAFEAIIKQGRKKHHIDRRWCEHCGKLIGEFHYCCCGYGTNGISDTFHRCPQIKDKK